MKIKVADATDVQIDFLVATIEGPDTLAWFWDDNAAKKYSPSNDPAQGQPIIEREKISVGFYKNDWQATSRVIGAPPRMYSQFGPTQLIAAMRCWIISKMGEEVEIPDELVSA